LSITVKIEIGLCPGRFGRTAVCYQEVDVSSSNTGRIPGIPEFFVPVVKLRRSCVCVLHVVNIQGFSGDIDLSSERVLEYGCAAESEED
jgi:hypothetical protein